MRVLLKWLGVAIVSLVASAAPAAHTHGRLMLDADAARPGDTVMAGVHLNMDASWHTYWRNAGEAGIPTTIDWQLPAGITAGEIQWPVPTKSLFADYTTYDYHDEVVLLVPLRLAAGASPGRAELRAKISWLECEAGGSCVLGSQNVSAGLNIGSESKASTDAALIERWLKKLPQDGSALAAAASWEQRGESNTRPFVIEWNAQGKPDSVDFFPYSGKGFGVLAATEELPYAAGKGRLRKQVQKEEGDWPAQITGVLIQKSGPEQQAYEVRLALAPSAGESLWRMLALAFIGGLILNIMPCVFPVIALKILGFVQQGNENPRQIFRLGLIYGLGVLVSFLVLAGMVIGVQQAGGAASWGMQLQNPQFSLVLTVLVTLVALNLFGLFEINLSGGALNVAGQLASKHGAAGAFFNGVLATVLATPCTAPFLAPALGFAFAQPPAIIVLFFTTIAVGLAAPYLVLSWQPAWLKFLPRPGAWMEKFKIAMGFPMLATAMWLFSFTAKRFGSDGPLWVGLFLIVTALAAWVWGEFVQRGRKRRGLAMAISLLLLLGGYGYGLERQLHWRSPVKKATTEGVSQNGKDGIAWQKWSADAVGQARAEGRPVLVDFTAEWCLTCQLNKRSSIEIVSVSAKLKEINAATFIADNTDNDPAIVAELKKFSRAGVPLVLVYPRDAQKPPLVLPAFLTPGIMLDALTKAAE